MSFVPPSMLSAAPVNLMPLIHVLLLCLQLDGPSSSLVVAAAAGPSSGGSAAPDIGGALSAGAAFAAEDDSGDRVQSALEAVAQAMERSLRESSVGSVEVRGSAWERLLHCLP